MREKARTRAFSQRDEHAEIGPWSSRGQAVPATCSLSRQARRRVTVTVNRARRVLPLVSVAVQVTLVRPSLKKLPDAGLQNMGTAPSTASCAVTE
jgi:hypothetical protein